MKADIHAYLQSHEANEANPISRQEVAMFFQLLDLTKPRVPNKE